jgi:RNA polymerase sigma-70 factor (ECF subfamily)
MPNEPEVAGLLALLLLLHARRRARVASDGALVRLADQDRGAWDMDLIAEGQALVARCVRKGRPAFYQLQAAINAVHSAAPSIADTDWSAILASYDQLYELAPTPVIALNRAVVRAEVEGPAAGLVAVDALTDQLDEFHLFHAARADLLRRLGNTDAAADAYRTARRLATNRAEQEFLEAQLASMATSR